MKEFTDKDVFINTLKVYPKVKFFGYSGSIYYNSSNEEGVLLNDFLISEDVDDD